VTEPTCRCKTPIYGLHAMFRTWMFLSDANGSQATIPNGKRYRVAEQYYTAGE